MLIYYNYMKIRLLSILLAGIYGQLNAQYCVSGGPGTTADSNVESVSIFGTSGSINYTGCPGIIGVEQYTLQTVSLGKGNSFTMDVQFGTCGGNYNGAGTVWIDYNQNYLFEASEIVGTWQGIPPTALSTFNFTVPLSASLGSTKMRVTQQEAGSLPLDPCASFSWGSVTDFNVTIVEGIDCSGYAGDDMADAINVTTLPYVDNSSNSICYSNQNPTYSSPDVYYRVVVNPANSLMKASLCGSTFDTFISVVEPNGTFIAGNDDATSCGPQSEVIFSTANHSIVYIIVEGWGTQVGDYTLTLEDDILGTTDQELDKLAIYPNPASESITLTNEKSGLVEIRDMSGSVVLNTIVEAFGNVSLESLRTGVYLLNFSSENHTTVKKLIKQ